VSVLVEDILPVPIVSRPRPARGLVVVLAVHVGLWQGSAVGIHLCLGGVHPTLLEHAHALLLVIGVPHAVHAVHGVRVGVALTDDGWTVQTVG